MFSRATICKLLYASVVAILAVFYNQAGTCLGYAPLHFIRIGWVVGTTYDSP